MLSQKLQYKAAAAACLAMIIQPAALAAPTGQSGIVADVALAEGGLLTGQLVNAQGGPLGGAVVNIQATGREAVRVATDQTGAFAASGLRGGIYQVSAEGYQGVYRLWAPRTAPPSANRGIMAVVGDATVRGQFGPPPAVAPPQPGMFQRGWTWVKNHPFITAGVVATAVAVPIALEDDDDPAS